MFCLRFSGQLGFDEFKELLDEVWKWKVCVLYLSLLCLDCV